MPFHYPCYTRLQTNLGRIDAICGYATVAVDLLSEEMRQNSNPREWLSGTAKLQGIVLHDVDDQLLPHRLAQMFIVTVHAQFEEFLHAFLEDHKESQAWDKRTDREPLFLYVLKNLGMLHQASCAQDRETVEYYRLIRNRFSHIEVNLKKVENQKTQLQKLLNVTAGHLPPKSYDQVDYGDFDLFTKAAKSVAFQMCLAARPSDVALAELAKGGDYRRLKRFQNNPNRYTNALKQKLAMDYGLDEAEATVIVRLVLGS
jgi:hypothetical protein